MIKFHFHSCYVFYYFEMQLYNMIGYEIGCCLLYLVIIFVWLPFIIPQRRYKEKKVFPRSTTECPGHRSNPDLFIRIQARYLLAYVNPDLHRVIYTSIIRVIPVIIKFVANTEPHDKCFPNQCLFMSFFSLN